MQIRYTFKKIFAGASSLFLGGALSSVLLFFLYALAVKRDVFGKSAFKDWGRGFTISFWRDL